MVQIHLGPRKQDPGGNRGTGAVRATPRSHTEKPPPLGGGYLNEVKAINRHFGLGLKKAEA
jgi:hypothetical protein